MKRDIIYLKMPFRYGHFVIEKRVPFLFKIMTLEMITEYLGIGLEELFQEKIIKSDRMPMAMVWCGYLAACKELFQKPKYKEAQAVKWNEYMPKVTRDKMMVDVGVMLASMTKNGEGKEALGGAEKKK